MEQIKTLWQSVILNLAQDIFGRQDVKNKNDAIRYIIQDPDFYVICDMADIKAEKLRQDIIKKLRKRRNNLLFYLLGKEK